MTEEMRTEGARWPQEYQLDDSCPVRGSNLCWKFANSTGCDACYINGLKEKHAKDEASERWEQTVRLLPKNIDELADLDTCWFCVGEKEPADGYAVVDMANPEPYSTKGMFFGFGKKVRTPVGSLVSLHIAICKKCRRAFRMVEFLQIACLIGMVALAIGLLAVPRIAQPMVNLFVLLPVVFLALMAGAGYAIGRSAAMAYMRRKSSEVNFDIGTIPLVASMLSRDWFFFQTDHGMPRMSFTKKKDRSRILPPSPSAEVIDTTQQGMVN